MDLKKCGCAGNANFETLLVKGQSPNLRLFGRQGRRAEVKLKEFTIGGGSLIPICDVAPPLLFSD